MVFPARRLRQNPPLSAGSGLSHHPDPARSSLDHQQLQNNALGVKGRPVFQEKAVTGSFFPSSNLLADQRRRSWCSSSQEMLFPWHSGFC